VPFGEVEEHCRIAARGKDPSSRGIRPEPPLFKILPPHHAPHSILPVKDYTCSTVEIEHGRRGSQLLELTPGFLAARAVAGAAQNRPPDCLDLHLAALAHREKVFVLLLIHCAHSWVPLWKAILSVVRNVRNGSNLRIETKPECPLPHPGGTKQPDSTSTAMVKEI
jgi:hypothetical protein